MARGHHELNNHDAPEPFPALTTTTQQQHTKKYVVPLLSA
jgi:hypothetical protein